jgi:hypothetical protein
VKEKKLSFSIIKAAVHFGTHPFNIIFLCLIRSSAYLILSFRHQKPSKVCLLSLDFRALFGWLGPASQQCFSLTPIQHQLAAISQPAVFFSHKKSASATSHQPAERGLDIAERFLYYT